MAIMKRYRIDAEVGMTLGNPPRNIVWVEEIVKIFGGIYYTERYSAISKNKAKKMKLFPKQKRGSGRCAA